ncbi:MAG: hypothetical protein ACRDWF_14025 [Acidimicrobiia bacterium]
MAQHLARIRAEPITVTTPYPDERRSATSHPIAAPQERLGGSSPRPAGPMRASAASKLAEDQNEGRHHSIPAHGAR